MSYTTTIEGANNLKGWSFLTFVAKKKTTCTYAEFAKAIGKYTPGARPNVTNELNHIKDYCKGKRLPLLNVLVVTQDTGFPGYAKNREDKEKAKKQIAEVHAYDWHDMPTRTQANLSSFEFPYTNCRNITPPLDRNDIRILTGYAPAHSFIDLPDDGNVREYLVDIEGEERNKPSDVHRAIRHTLCNNINDFPMLNGGIVIVAEDVEIDDKNRTLTLDGSVSIINGSQTRGELKHYLKNSENREIPLVRFEVIAMTDEELRNDISISRNFQNRVAYLSILGREGNLDELREAFHKKHPNLKLTISESSPKHYVRTEKLLQICFALLPEELFSFGSKTTTYSSQAKWLKKFKDLYENQQKEDHERDHEKEKIYRFILDIAGDAWDLYRKWKQDKDLTANLSTVRKNSAVIDDGNDNKEAVDGLLFPIIASYSVFVKEKNGQWCLDGHEDFEKRLRGRIISTAKQTYASSAGYNPQIMGRTIACYEALMGVSDTYLVSTDQ